MHADVFQVNLVHGMAMQTDGQTCLCTFICIHTHTHKYTHIHIHMFVPTYVHTYTYMHKHTYTYIRACVFQVRWRRGIPMDPHVVVLEAGLDGRAFDDDLPVAPWLWELGYLSNQTAIFWLEDQTSVSVKPTTVTAQWLCERRHATATLLCARCWRKTLALRETPVCMKKHLFAWGSTCLHFWHCLFNSSKH